MAMCAICCCDMPYAMRSDACMPCCGQHMHGACVQQWLLSKPLADASCALCRRDITPENASRLLAGTPEHVIHEALNTRLIGEIQRAAQQIIDLEVMQDAFMREGFIGA